MKKIISIICAALLLNIAQIVGAAHQHADSESPPKRTATQKKVLPPEQQFEVLKRDRCQLLIKLFGTHSKPQTVKEQMVKTPNS